MLTPAVAEALESVRIHRDACGATIAGLVIEASGQTELRCKLADALYDLCHAGYPVHTGEPTGDANDPDFARRLAESVPHSRTRVWCRVISTIPGGLVIVELDSVRVRLPASLLPAGVSSGDIVPIDLDCARPRLSPGFFLVDGSAGHGLTAGAESLRIYIHLVEPDTAIAVWESILTLLEGMGVPYRAKISSAARFLPRNDALVIYLGRFAWAKLRALLAELPGIPGLGKGVSCYALSRAPGISVAWSPNDTRPGMARLSFGEHRSMAVADGLLAHACSGVARDQAVADALRDANVDPAQPFQNLTSPVLDTFW